MQVLRLYWLGTRTTNFVEMTRFFRDVLQLEKLQTESHFSVFALPDGSSVEVFGPDSPYNRHLVHPVGGFLVVDLEEAQRELEENRIEIVLPPQDGGDRRWLHFRAPDGFVYELVQYRRPRTLYDAQVGKSCTVTSQAQGHGFGLLASTLHEGGRQPAWSVITDMGETRAQIATSKSHDREM